METLMTNKTVSLTELRDPKRVLEKAGNSPVAVLNRNHLEGYFVPASAVDKISFDKVDNNELLQVLNNQMDKMKPTLDYLIDK